MNEKTWAEAMSLLDERLLDEALHYQKRRRPLWLRLGAAAACLALIAALGLTLLPGGGMTVTAYAHGTDEALTAAGAVMNTGTIRDTGELTGHPLQFYLAGEDIESVRFSCREQQLVFTDWTETREEFGRAQNFTVPYGADESEYYYLLIDWEPVATIRALTDDAASTIAALPESLRSDRIVLEIRFADGSTAVKAIEVRLLDNGSFFASFDDYTVTAEDTFVARDDAAAIPRDQLYGPDGSGAWQEDYPFGDAPVIEGGYQDADPDAPETVVPDSTLTFTGTIADSWTDNGTTSILVTADGDSALRYAHAAFRLTAEQADWADRVGQRVVITCGDTFMESEPPIGDLRSIEATAHSAADIAAAKQAARDYYAGTVFTVEWLHWQAETEDGLVLTARVSKGGVTQEPDRSITLRQENGGWTVVNEGY